MVSFLKELRGPNPSDELVDEFLNRKSTVDYIFLLHLTWLSDPVVFYVEVVLWCELCACAGNVHMQPLPLC